MYYLYAMNIYIYIFIFHLVANQEKYFLKLNGIENKIEINLNLESTGGQNLRNILKKNKTIESRMGRSSNNRYYEVSLADIGPKPKSKYPPETKYQKGEIAANNGKVLIFVFQSSTAALYERIGNIINPTEFPTSTSSTSLKFLLEEEKEEKEEKKETPKKKKKSEDWKTMKILKRVKSLERYRITKKLEKLKSLKN